MRTMVRDPYSSEDLPKLCKLLNDIPVGASQEAINLWNSNRRLTVEQLQWYWEKANATSDTEPLMLDWPKIEYREWDVSGTRYFGMTDK